MSTIFGTNLLCVHDSTHSHSQRHGGHLWEVSVKEAGIGQDGVSCQGLHSGPGDEARTRLVECNVAIRSNTWQGGGVIH